MTDLPDGLHVGVPMADYLAMEALSSSGCKVLASQSPRAYRYGSADSTPAQTLGTLAHTMILEPERLVRVMPAADMRTNAGKEALVEWLIGQVGEPVTRPPAKAATGTVMDLYLAELRPRLAATGDQVASAADYALAIGMRDAILDRCEECDATRAAILGEGVAEAVGLVTDLEYGVRCKVRPDRLLTGARWIVSLKTCQSVGARDYLRAAWAYGYPGAAWWYPRIMEAITGEAHQYVEVAVESAPPHDVRTLTYTDAEVAEAESAMRRGLDTYRRCIESGLWPGSGWVWGADGTPGGYEVSSIGRGPSY